MSFCARPVGLAAETLCCAICRMVSTDSCLAVSMNEQVFTTITSASSARGVICAPAEASMPIMTSLSTRFLGQPRLTKPTLVGGATDGEFVDMESSYFIIGRFGFRGLAFLLVSRVRHLDHLARSM